jgi:YbbR domain-containing protein
MNRQNLGYKLMALSIAVIIWYYVNYARVSDTQHAHKSPYISKEFTLPLETRKLEDGCVVVSAPKKVTVRVEGRQDYVNDIAYVEDEIQAYVNLHGRGEGSYKVPVIVKLPEEYAGLIQKSPEPRTVDVVVAKKAQREMAIEPRLTGDLPDGYKFGEPEIMPAKGVIYGVSKRVNAVARLVAAVDLGKAQTSGVVGDFLVVALDASGRVVNGVEVTPDKVNVRLQAEEAPVQKRLLVSVDTVGLPPFPYKVTDIEVGPQMLLVTGSAKDLLSLTTLETEPINLASHRQSFSERLAVVAPDGIMLDTDTVTVTVKISSPRDAGDGGG